MENQVNKRLKPDDFFKSRIAKVKASISGQPWKARFLEMNPDWNNAADLDYLNRVFLLRTADVFVTEQLERIALEFSDDEIEEQQ